MLPDYLVIKEKLNKLQLRRFKKVQESVLFPFSNIPKSRVFEGDRIIIVRQDGTEAETKLELMRVERRVNYSEFETFNPEKIVQEIDAAAEELGLQMAKSIVGELDRATKEIGNVVEAGGNLQPKHFFEMMEKIQIEFDENEKELLPSFIVGPKAMEAVSKLFSELESNPEHKKRFDKIIKRKREEWREREVSRKLVE